MALTPDYAEIARGYNKRMGTKYTEKAFLKMAYKRNGSLLSAAEWVGTSQQNLVRRMRELGIAITPQTGGYHGGPTLREKLLQIPVDRIKEMTIGDLQKAIGSNYPDSIRVALRENGILWNKSRGKSASPKLDAFMALDREEIKDMTVDEIAAKIGSQNSYMYVLLSRFRIPYKRKPNSVRFRRKKR